MFPTIETEGYISSENQWAVIMIADGKADWISFSDTKAEAVECLKDAVDKHKPEFIMVVKSPYVAAEE